MVDVRGYIPDGAVLSDGLNGGTLAVSGGSLILQLAARWAAVLVTPPGADLTPPAAPESLVAAENAGQVDLTWQPVPGAEGYFVYRSLVTGGGFTRLNGTPLAAARFTDSPVRSGQSVYYVITALDGAGNESARSNEVTALPH